MTIALDYDRTITADPDGWLECARLMGRRGHRVVLVTGRHGEDTEVVEWAASVPIETVFCWGSRKRAACAVLGLTPDVWIDDLPELI